MKLGRLLLEDDIALIRLASKRGQAPFSIYGHLKRRKEFPDLFLEVLP
jgi:hypothetical protein